MDGDDLIARMERDERETQRRISRMVNGEPPGKPDWRDAPGIVCPNCGDGRTRVSYRQPRRACWWRRRYCEECRTQFSTIEQMTGNVQIPHSIYRMECGKIPPPPEFSPPPDAADC